MFSSSNTTQPHIWAMLSGSSFKGNPRTLKQSYFAVSSLSRVAMLTCSSVTDRPVSTVSPSETHSSQKFQADMMNPAQNGALAWDRRVRNSRSLGNRQTRATPPVCSSSRGAERRRDKGALDMSALQQGRICKPVHHTNLMLHWPVHA